MIQRLAVILSEDAIADLEGIALYILEQGGSESVASSFVDRIKQRCNKIGDVPRGGRPRDDIVLGLRTVPFEHSAIIAYIVTANEVRVTNIFYGGRDYEAMLREA